MSVIKPCCRSHTGPRLPATTKLHVLESAPYSYLCFAGTAIQGGISEETFRAPGSPRQPEEGSLQKENTAFSSTEKQSSIIAKENYHHQQTSFFLPSKNEL